ncbi:hypothetical protein D3C87_1377120 [compost metagenome]
MVDPADHIAAALVQATGTEIVVLRFEHDARQFLLATPELRHVQQRLGHTMTPRRGVHRQFVDMGKAVPIGADHQVTHRLVVEKRHENCAVRCVAKTAELFGINAVAFAIGRDRRDPPLLHRQPYFRRSVSRDFKTEVAAPDVGGKTFVGNTHRQPWMIWIHDRLHTGKGPHSLMQSTV